MFTKMSSMKPATWSCAQVARWVEAERLGLTKEMVEKYAVTGIDLRIIEECHLREFGVQSAFERKQVLRRIVTLFTALPKAEPKAEPKGNGVLKRKQDKDDDGAPAAKRAASSAS